MFLGKFFWENEYFNKMFKNILGEKPSKSRTNVFQVNQALQKTKGEFLGGFKTCVPQVKTNTYMSPVSLVFHTIVT